MATYIQGVTDYIPKIQPFTPDFNFYATALQTMQTKYDTNYKQLSQYYGRLLRSNMLRDDNIERRKQFETAIMNDIKKISGMDLSLQQNVDAAMQVLDPLVNDKYIINDIVKTRQWNDARNTGENLNNTEYGWQGGMRALDYWAQDFRAVNADDALNFQKAEYVPYINVYEKAIDDAKANKWEVKMDNFSKDGKFIVTNKNGDMIAPTLRDYFIGRFGRDPQVMKFFNTEAYIERKDYISANKGKFNGNEAMAQMEYAQAKLDQSVKAIKEAKIDAKQKQEMIDNYMDLYADYVKKNGLLPNDSKTINQGKALQQAQQNVTNTNAVVSQQAKTLELYEKDYQDFLNNGQKLDQIISYNNMYKILDAAAKGYANLTAEFTIKGENPYALEQVKASNAIALEGVKHRNRMLQIAEEGKYKDKTEKSEEQKQTEKGVNANTQLQTVENMPGATTGMTTTGMKENIKKHNEFFGNAITAKATYLADVTQELVAKYNDPNTSDLQKKGIKNTLTSIYDKAPGSYVNVNDLLNPTTRQKEIEKIRMSTGASNPEITNQYNDMNRYMDLAGNPANDLKPKYAGIKTRVDHVQQGYDAYNAQRIDQRERILVPYFEDPKNDPTGLVSAILENSPNGFFPSYGSLAEKEKVIKKIAAAAQAEYGSNNLYTEDYIRKNWEAAKQIFYNSSGRIPNYNGWNHYDALPGRGSTGKATMGTTGAFDYSERGPGSTTEVVDQIFQDIQKGVTMLPTNEDNAGMGVILVGYGDGSTVLTESDAKAAEELKAILADRMKGAAGKYNKDRGEYEYGDTALGGTFSYANIAQNDPNYIQFNFTPSARYAQSTSPGKDQPGYVSGEQLTVRIPVSIAQNILYKQSQTTLNEYLYQKGTLGRTGDTGKFDILNMSTGPKGKIDYQVIDPNTGSITMQTAEESFTDDYEIDDIYDRFDQMLDLIEAQNAQAKISAAMNQGLIGDNALSILNGGQ
jgi:hypothetical protein